MDLSEEPSLAQFVFGQLHSQDRVRTLEALNNKFCESIDQSSRLSLVNLILDISELSRAAPANNDLHKCLEKSQILSLKFVSAQINDCPQQTNNTAIVDIAKLCLKQSSITDRVYYQCLRSLTNKIILLAEHANSGFEVYSQNNLALVRRIALQTSESYDDSLEIAFEPCLTFLQSTFLNIENETTLPFAIELFVVLYVLIGAKSQALSQGSLKALIALLRVLRLHKSSGLQYIPEVGKNLFDLIWEAILGLTKCKTNAKYSSAGYALWSRLLSSSLTQFPDHSDLRSSDYWTQIQTGIAEGTAEQQKYSLNLLRHSIKLLVFPVYTSRIAFNPELGRQVVDQYGRYGTIAETLIVSRYLNQVKDCLEDLLILSSPDSLVHKSWIVALLSATLRHGVQDSIRKILGNWTLLYGCQVLTLSPETASDFIENVLLPWATLGFHFTSTIYKNDKGSLNCNHGDHLALFLTSLLTSMSNDSLPALQSCINGILRFLKSNVGRLYPFTRAFVLEGLVNGLESISYPLDQDELNSVLDIFSMGTLHEIVRDIMTLYCARICSLAKASSSNVQNPRLTTLKLASDLIKSGVTEIYDGLMTLRLSDKTMTYEGGSQWVASDPAESFTFKRFNKWLELSRHTCLRADGLIAAFTFLYQAISETPLNDLDIQEVDFAFRAIWDETEIQDYAKKALMECPRVFFHEKIMLLSGDNDHLTATISEIASQLQKLAQNRIHAWSPLASALRRAFLVSPKARRLFLPDFILSLVSHPPVTKIDFQFEAIMANKMNLPERHYSHYYGHFEGHGYACAFDALNRLPIGKEEGAVYLDLIYRVLRQWLKQRPPVPIFSSWKTTNALQIVLILVEKIWETMDDTPRNDLLRSLLMMLSIEPLPRYRYLLEWIIVRIYIRDQGTRPGILDILSSLDGSNPKHSVSIMKICLMIACLPKSDEHFALALMTILIPLSGSQKIIIRHEAQWTFPWLWDEAVRRGWTSLLENPAFQSLNAYIRSLESYKNPHPWRLQERFDPIRDHNLTNLFQGEYLTIEPSEPEQTSRDDFLEVQSLDIGVNIENFPSTIPLGEARFKRPAIVPKQIEISTELQSFAVSATPLQTKSSLSWKSSDYGSDNHMTLSSQRRAREIVVVASLIDNPYNLGGLSRLAEIFGAQSLKVQDIRVIKNRDFTSVSVSSHMWLNIEELQPEGIPEFLRECKTDGYALIGIEQTDRSRVLGKEDWKMPCKIVLVLGSEREGIPAKLLADMDHCVEVEQLGVTRSMNVQTAAAVVLYEHSRQFPGVSPSLQRDIA